jgi:hypothetical protein
MTQLTWKREETGIMPLVGFLGKHEVCKIRQSFGVNPNVKLFYLGFDLPSINEDNDWAYSYNEENLQQKAEETIEKWLVDGGI